MNLIQSLEYVKTLAHLSEYGMLLVECGEMIICQLDEEVGVVEVWTHVGGCHYA